VEIDWIAVIDLDSKHDASNISVIVSSAQ
jgi:hypothetical protein